METLRAEARQPGSDGAAVGHILGEVNHVVVGTEGLAAAIFEISECAKDARELGDGAVDAARVAQDTVRRLSEASEEIDQAVRGITAVARQTKLLALNATIEAARAGDSGRGFAIVASEVKNLAQESAQAATAVNDRIAAVQAGIAEALEAIGHISRTIRHVNDFQQAIEASVQEQIANASEVTGRAGAIVRAVESLGASDSP